MESPDTAKKYCKKGSLNCDTTKSNESCAKSKIIENRKVSSVKLTDNLYCGTSRSKREKNSPFQDQNYPKTIELEVQAGSNPFLSSKMQYLLLARYK